LLLRSGTPVWALALLTLVALVAPPAGAAAAGAKVERVVRVAIDREYEPYEFVDAQGAAAGFTPDLLRDIAEETDLRFEFVPLTWPEAMAALESGEVHLVSMIRTPDRLGKFEFSAPHSRITQAIFRRSGASDISGLASLGGHVVGLQRGDVSEAELGDRTDFQRRFVNSKLEGMLLLNTGRLEAFLCAQQAGVRLVSANGLSQVELATSGLFPQDLAFAARRGDRSLIQLLDAQLEKHRASGELAVLQDRWLGGRLSPSGWLARYRVYLAAAGVGLALALSLVLVWTWQLKRTVRARTAALKESEARVRLAVRGGALGLWDWDVPSGRVTHNERWAEMLGYSLGEIEPNVSTWERLVHPDDMPRVRPLLDAHLRGESASYATEHRLRHKDGHWVWVLDSGVVVARAPDGSALRAAGTQLDITERKRAEDALRESEERYRSVVTSMAEGVVVLNADRVVTASNPAAERILGLAAQEMGALFQPNSRWRVVREDGSPFAAEDNPALVALRSGLSQLNVVMGFRRSDGALTWIKSNSEPLRDPAGRIYGVVTTIADITERRALREQLTVSSRLAAMGTLVAGVAHEVNNPLAGQMASQGMALEELRKLARILRREGPLEREAMAGRVDEMVSMIGDAQLGSERIARIVKDLSLFGRPSLDRSPVQLEDVVESAMRWLPASVGREVTVRVESGTAPPVRASAGQLEQVVVNLVTNAALAIPAGRHGEIVIRLGVGPSGMARLDVTDNGTGIDPTLMERIVDPFVTTRGVGRGTGLGLSICHSIVTAHGGTLTVTSSPGAGSTFRMELPAFAAEPVTS
jgi:PAS domain S-box-containing protein